MTWDSGRAGIGAVIKVDEIYRMYYHSFNYVWGVWKIGVATSTDGINWEKFPEPVFSGRPGYWDEKISANHIEIIDNTYYMYYTGHHYGWDYKIGLAKSEDGFTWARHQDSPILDISQNWEDDGVGYPSIIKEDNVYKMIYSEATFSNNGFGLAESYDGVTWVKSPNNPIFTTLNTSQGWDKIAYSSIINTGSDLRLYYSGFDQNLIMNINFATYQE